MFLKSIELFGFKSFADRWKFDFTEGITALLGPNGAGKSNVVDSVKWVLGTSAPSSVRVTKNEDVIFKGTASRPPMQYCEVILTINNEMGLLNIEATEVQIKRKLSRNSGLSEYFINQAPCRLADIRSLFMDTGVGKVAYSILEQGKIDLILSAKAEDRRYIFEEAAGISKSKIDKDVASRNLQRNEEDLKQIRIQFDSSKSKYDRLKIQVDQVRKRKELEKEKEDLFAELQLSYVQSVRKLIEKNQTDADLIQKEVDELNRELEGLSDQMKEKNDQLESLRIRQSQFEESVHRNEEKKLAAEQKLVLINQDLDYQRNRISTSESNVKKFEERLNLLKEALNSYQAQYNSKQAMFDKCSDRENRLTEEILKIDDNIADYNEKLNRLNVLNDDLAQKRTEINNKIYNLASEITSKLSGMLKGSGYSTQSRKEAESNFIAGVNKAVNILNSRIQVITDLVKTGSSSSKIVDELNNVHTDLLDEFNEIKGLFQEYNGIIPTFLDEFMDPESTLSEKNILDGELNEIAKQEDANDKLIEDYNKQIGKLKEVQMLNSSELDELKEEKAGLATDLQVLRNNMENTESNISQFDSDFKTITETYKTELGASEVLKNNMSATEQEILRLQERIEEDSASNEALKDKINEILTELNKENEANSRKFERRQELNEQLIRNTSNIEVYKQQIDNYFTAYFEQTRKSLKTRDDHEVTATTEDLKSRLESVESKITHMGNVNYLAEEEFEEAERTYQLYSSHLEDITKSVEDLQSIVEKINTESTERFVNTFNQINEAFMEMFTTLFCGGKAKLELTDPENALESGIEIMAQPPGKALMQLFALSGGERTMTAVALLFATYMVKPSPFCILDELDAPLDANNVDAFLRGLDKFGDKSQFIVITHNKKTAMGASSILGVTQQEPGVSIGMSYRLSDVKDDTGTEATLK